MRCGRGPWGDENAQYLPVIVGRARSVLMRVEQEQKVTEDARAYAEQDTGAQRYATEVIQIDIKICIIQEKLKVVAASLAEIENRAIMEETMYDETLQYQAKLKHNLLQDIKLLMNGSEIGALDLLHNGISVFR